MGTPEGWPGDGKSHTGALQHQHVTGPVDYTITPPVGGPHNAVWMNAGVYTKPVPTERAVHNLEHGAVWITYDPDLAASKVAKLRGVRWQAEPDRRVQGDRPERAGEPVHGPDPVGEQRAPDADRDELLGLPASPDVPDRSADAEVRRHVPQQLEVLARIRLPPSTASRSGRAGRAAYFGSKVANPAGTSQN